MGVFRLFVMYTYTFLAFSPDRIVLPTGITGSLELVRINQIAAVVEPELAFETLQASDERLIQAVLIHDRIIRELFNQTTVLPLRFGTRFVSREKLVEHLEIHEAAYLKKLIQLTGKAEYPLKLIPAAQPEPSIDATVKGRDYFLAKKQRIQTQADWQQQQQMERSRLAQLLAQTDLFFQEAEPNEGIERFYLLSDRQNEDLLLKSLESWQSVCPHWELSIGEGLPPYHFV